MRILKAIFFAIFILCDFASFAIAENCPGGKYLGGFPEGCFPPKPWEDDQAYSKPMSFRMRQYTIRAEATWIAAEGVITENTADKFYSFIKENDIRKENRVVFHSPGGNLYAAMELGRAIRRAGLSTSVGRSTTLDIPGSSMDVYYFDESWCLSACAYAFLGGESRVIPEGASLGFHRFGSSDFAISQEVAQIASSDLANYLQEMGVDQGVLGLASRADFVGDMSFINPEVAARLRIVFDPSDASSRVNVEMWRGHVVGNFSFIHKGLEFFARFHCIDKYPRLVVWAPRANFPADILSTPGLVALFNEGSEGEFWAKVEVGLIGNEDAYITFSSLYLINSAMAGSLKLSFIYPPNWNERQAFDRIMWVEQSLWLSFNLEIENAAATLPIVSSQCR